MTLGECNGMDGVNCIDCGASLKLKICKSNTGWYLGYWCEHDGPISRETNYFNSQIEAEQAIKNPEKYAR